ncbi:MAG: aminoglycoside adenylyltransferase domain-containing protein [Chloroflexota bacterium]
MVESVEALLAVLVDETSLALGANRVGVYLRGSLALGDFDAQTSDVDVLVAVAEPLTPADAEALIALHGRVSDSTTPFAHRLEITYMDVGALDHFVPGQKHLTLGQGEVLAWREHDTNWVIERWILRERGIALVGPSPRDLIALIDEVSLKGAVRHRLSTWRAWMDDPSVDPDDDHWDVPTRVHTRYIIETMCRALCTLETGEIRTKPQAIRWARGRFAPRWLALVDATDGWGSDPSVDTAIVPELRMFLSWATDPSLS